MANTAWHALLWLVLGNAIGVMLATLLLFPSLNQWLGEWTYGRWIMVHMNIALYGWCSIPMIAFLFKAYGADRGPTAAWCRPILWAWSAALAMGCVTWLSGHSSGKLFLDWAGYARIVFPLAMGALWVLLAVSLAYAWNTTANATKWMRIAKLLGLVLLLSIPIAIYVASGPDLYPAVNPDTGGPTGTSQLESSLMVVAILLIIPFGLVRRKAGNDRAVIFCWTSLACDSTIVRRPQPR